MFSITLTHYYIAHLSAQKRPIKRNITIGKLAIYAHTI